MKIRYSTFFIFSIIIFSLSCIYYYPFISDDSLISLRYAQRFIDGKGLSWNDGHPVEGYSNLLWILLISMLGKLNIDLILSARILGIACSLGTVGAILNYFRKQDVKKGYVFLSIILLITTPSFAVWAIGGLEQPLYVFLMTLVLIDVLRIVNTGNLNKIYLLSIWLGLLALTRPDGFLFTLLTSVFFLAINFRNKQNLLKIGLATIIIPTLFLLGQLIFRYSYYGEFVPNTALVKVRLTIHHILRGGFYHFKAFFSTILISVPGIYFIYHLIKKKHLFAYYLLLNVISWILYVTLVGGDIFPAFRHYYIVLIFYTFAIILGLNHLKTIDFKNKKHQIRLAIILVVNTVLQPIFPDNQYAVKERWEFKGMRLGEKLKNTFPEKTLIAVTAAGCIPYSSGLPSIDMLGLNDYYIPRHPPANFGYGALAHELGDAKYVMHRNPDVIIFHTGGPINFNIGEQLKANKTFNENYIKVIAEEKDNEYILFFNKYGNSSGIKKDGQTLNIPGYLFVNPHDAISIFREKKLLKNISKSKLYEITLNNISDKRWRINNTNFQSEIIYKSNSLTIIIKSDKNTFLESIVLQQY